MRVTLLFVFTYYGLCGYSKFPVSSMAAVRAA